MKEKNLSEKFQADYNEVRVKIEEILGLDTKFISELGEIHNQISLLFDTKFKEELIDIRMILEKISEKSKNVISFATIKFQIKGSENAIELCVHSHDNVVKVKREICSKWSRAKLHDYKIMNLIHNKAIVDPNRYLLSCIGMENITIDCDFDRTIPPNDIVILQLRSNREVPELIQVHKHKTIIQLKTIISQINNSKDLVIFKDQTELKNELTIERSNLVDYDWIRAIMKESGVLTLHSIFDDRDPWAIEYTNVDTVSSLKCAIGKKKHLNFNDFVLFSNNRILEDNKLLFELGLEHEYHIRYCRFKSLDDLDFAGDVITDVKGDFSDILLARKLSTEQDVIVKRYQLTETANLKNDEALLNELTTFQLTKGHERFVQLFGVCKDAQFLFIEIEKMDGGSITEYLVKHWPLNDRTVCKWSTQILEGLKFIHDKDIIHRDLKPSNILVDGNHDVKLSSFCLAKYTQGFWKHYLMEGFEKSNVKKFRHMAPEVCNDETYGKPADVWSFGATLVEIVTGLTPYPNKTEANALFAISKSLCIEYELPPGTAVELKSFIHSCLKSDPSERPTVDKLLKDAFLRS